MKKYIIKIGLLFFATFLFLSCNDEFLERYPLDKVSNETYWSSENDLLVYNNLLYNYAMDDNKVPIMLGNSETDYARRYGILCMDGFTDNTAPRHSRHDRFSQVRAGKHVVPTGAPEWFGYKGFDFVRAINVGLDHYQNADIAQSVIDKYAGEAYLFRGWFYGEKVFKFGDVSWMGSELNIDSEELFAPRTPRNEVMDSVLVDLNLACEKLPNDWGDGNEPGRLNRWCALAVKTRYCLYEGTWRKYHGGPNADMWLQEAADAAKDLIENGPYSIFTTGDPYHDYNSYHRTPDITGNPEVIYYRKYVLGQMVNSMQIYLKEYLGGATKSVVEDYLCTDGLPITLSPLYKGDAVFEDLFENRDPRLRQTVLHPADVAFYEFGNNAPYSYPRLLGMSGGLTSSSGYSIIKIYNNDEAYARNGLSPGITLRLAETLLSYAEAKAELGNITQADLDMSINKLRDRVAMPHMTLDVPMDPRYANDGVSALIVEIRRERRLEMFLEGLRMEDLKRWKQGRKLILPDMGMRWDAAAKAKYDPDGKVTMKSSIDPVLGIEYIDIYKGTSWEGPVFDENKHYFWPIPLRIITQNTNIKQNPGW